MTSNSPLFPTVSVCITTYNGEKYLSEQLDSILAQTYPIKEIIISDDNSSDNSWEIINSYCKRFHTIKAFRNNTSLGPNDNFVKTFKLATGDIIAPSDQDDVWRKDKIKTLIDCLTPEYDIVYAQDISFWEDGSIDKQIWHSPQLQDAIWNNRLRGHTCIFRKRLLELYQYSGLCSWDYTLAIYGAISGRILELPDYLVNWRRHNNAVTFCTRHAHLPKHNKYQKLLSTCWELIKGHKSDSITMYLNSRLTYIRALMLVGPNRYNDKTVNICCKILAFTSKQTLWTLIMAGYYNILLYKKLNIGGG